MDDPTRYLPEEESPGALAVLFACSVVEYVFPPFPGDTVTVFGAFLVAARGWSMAAVFLATTLGSVAGATVDWLFGVVLQRWRGRRLPRTRAGARTRAALDRLVAGFARHGPVYILLNRFLPGIRALFFVAAGLAGMRPAPVLLYATISAVAWNALLMAAGLAVGASWETLYGWFVAYTRVVWALLGGVAVVAAVVWWRGRGRRGEE